MLDSPVIIITGASSGIGAASAYLFSQNGYRVVLVARRLDLLQNIANNINVHGGKALPVQADVSCLEDTHVVVQTTLQKFGQVDILFNNAGYGVMNWLESLDPLLEIKPQIDVNLLGMVWMTQAVLPHMIERRSGHIINMASLAGLIAPPAYSVYAATKFAVRGFSEALRREVGMYGVCVSLICPGNVATEFGNIAGFRRLDRTTPPSFLVLCAEDIARAVLRLAINPRRMVVIPHLMRFATYINYRMPGILDWFLENWFVKLERGYKKHIPE